MAAPKGNCFNPAGRPVGSKSLKTQQWEYFVEYCMSEGLERFSVELNALKGKEYVNAFSGLLEYFKPKLSRFNGRLSGPEKVEFVIRYDKEPTGEDRS